MLNKMRLEEQYFNIPYFKSVDVHVGGILPKGPYPPCLRMADRPFWQDTLDVSPWTASSSV